MKVPFDANGIYGDAFLLDKNGFETFKKEKNGVIIRTAKHLRL